MGKNTKMYLSFSKISTYLKCPERYKFIYVEGLPTSVRSYFSFGNSIHKALEDFYKEDARLIKNKSPSVYLLELLEKNWISEGYSSIKEEVRAKGEAKRILSKYYRAEMFTYKPALAVEKEFSFDFNGIDVKGRIDRIDDSPGGVSIVDYKTSNLLPDLFKEEEIMQPLIYKIGVSSILPGKNVEKITFYFLRHGKKINFEINENLLLKGTQRMTEVINEILKGNFYPKVNGFCGQCEFRNICPAFK